jgi:hypothetical protein
MKRIYKYELPGAYSGLLVLALPANAEIISTGVQNDMPVFWALVNPENNLERRCFSLYKTGDDIDFVAGKNRFIGTYSLRNGKYILHLFENL